MTDNDDLEDISRKVDACLPGDSAWILVFSAPESGQTCVLHTFEGLPEALNALNLLTNQLCDA